jgi:hypothetical protein
MEIETDCKTEEGIIISLIDTIINSARVVVQKTQGKLFSQETLDKFSEVFKDLHNDEDVYCVMKMFNHNSRIMSDEDIKLMESIKELHKKIVK